MEEMTGNPRVFSSPSLVRKAPYEHTTCWQNKKTQYHGYTVTTWTVCRTRMRSAERAAKLADFHVTNAANLCHRVKGGGVTCLNRAMRQSRFPLSASFACG